MHPAARYQTLLDGNSRFGSSATDICLHVFNLPPERIHERVIIAPWWQPDYFDSFAAPGTLPLFPRASVLVWDLIVDGKPLTYVKQGIGAPKTLDVVLALGLTPCKEVIFIGSVGALSEQIAVGDVVVPMYSVCGVGANRYLKAGALSQGDSFGEKLYPGAALNQKLVQSARQYCGEAETPFHIGKTFCIDTIFAQFAYIDEIIAMGCDTIEMETCAAFEAGEMAGLQVAALFSVSDNTVAHKSLYSGRTEEEIQRRKRVRKELFPKILMRAFE